MPKKVTLKEVREWFRDKKVYCQQCNIHRPRFTSNRYSIQLECEICDDIVVEISKERSDEDDSPHAG